MNKALLSISRRAVSSDGPSFVLDTEAGEMVETTDPRPYPFLDILTTLYGFAWALFNIRPSDMFSDFGAHITEQGLVNALKAATIAWVNKGLTIIRLIDADGNFVDWNAVHEFGPFAFRPSAKIGKRLSFLAWQTWTSLMGVRMDILDASTMDDGIKHLPRKERRAALRDPNRRYTIKLLDDSAIQRDGIILMRRSMWKNILDACPNREAVSHMYNVVNYNGRIITPIGLIKGNILICADDRVDADIIAARDHNLKDEVWSIDGLTYLAMYPEHQGWFGHVKMDRQTRSHFWGWLFDRPMVEGFFRKWMTRLQTDLQAGVLPAWATKHHTPKENSEEVGTVSDFNQRFRLWAEAGLSGLDSLGLFQQLAGSVRLQLDPPSRKRNGKKDSLKFPVEYAISGLMRSHCIVREANYNIPALSRGQIYVDREIGVIFHDDDYDRVFGYLGGADQDDHVVVHFRIGRNEDGSVRPVGVCIRNPIGGAFGMDGARATEFFVADVYNWTDIISDSDYAPMEIPQIDLTKRPHYMDEVEVDEKSAGIFAAKFEEYLDGFGSEFTRESMFSIAIGSATAAQVYGFHSNLMTFAIMYGIPLRFFGFEEMYVDTCQQTPEERAVALISKINEVHALQICDYIHENGLRIDKLDWDRIGKAVTNVAMETERFVPLPSKDKGSFAPSASSELFEFHREMMDELTEFVITTGNDIKADLSNQFPAVKPVSLTWSDSPLPYIYQGFRALFTMVEKHKKDNGLSRKFTTADYTAIANKMASLLVSVAPTPEERSVLFREALGHMTGSTGMRRTNKSHLEAKFERDDKNWLSGEFLPLYVEFLRTERGDSRPDSLPVEDGDPFSVLFAPEAPEEDPLAVLDCDPFAVLYS